MKRFFKKSYSWLATLLLAVAFAVSGNVAAQTVFTFGSNDGDYQVLTFKKDGISVTGFGYNCSYAAWGDYPSLNMFVDADAGPRTITVSVPTGTIEKIEMTTTQENGTNSNFKDATVNTGTFSANGNTSAEWTGSASEVVFTPGENTSVYINKITVYATGVEAGGEEGGEEGGAEPKMVELPFAFTTSAGGTIDGVGYYMWTANWTDATELYGEGGATATWGTVNLTCAAANIIKVELSCRTNSWSSVSSNEEAATTVCETENLEGYFTYSGNVATWVGAAHSLTFSSTNDIDVYKIVVYTLEDGTVKECTIDVDHFADNCKPGKVESISKWITLYMQANTLATGWTGGHNCPEGVTFTTEAGEEIPVDQFNYWAGSNQIGVNLYDAVTTPGVYTLHIPEGLVAFEGGKFNKEINATWTVVEPDNRPTKEVVFDFTDGTYTNDGTTSYTKEGVVITLNENRYNATAQGFRIGTDGWVSFTAPEKASLKNIQLLQESSYGVNVDFSANVGEVSGYEKTLNWSGDDASVTLTDNYGTCYFTKAIVTLAVEETEVVDPVEPTDLSKFAGEWFFKGEGAYCNSPENIDGALNPKSEYTVNVDVQNGEIYMTGLVGDVYDYPYAYYGYYDAEANTLRFHTNSYIEDPNYEYYLMDQPLVFNVVKDEDGNISLVNTTGWDFIYEDWYYSQYACGFTSCTMTREKQAPVEPVTEPFELIVKNNNVLCANGAEVEAAEYGIASDFYLGNEGLTAKGNTATLYKDGSAMSFSITMVSNTGISFFGGASQFTEPGTYTLEVPAGTYVDAAGNPSIAFTGTWVLAQKDEPVVDPTTKDKYTIKLSGTDYYFTTTEVKDNSVTTYSISATPEYFYIEPSGNGYTIKSADTDKWVGYDVISTWDFSNDEKVWQIGSLEGEPTLIYKNGSKGFGVDNRFEGAGVYTDKSNQYWVIEKVVETEPTEWNGNVLYPETAANLDDLLSYTIEFEEATTVEASGYDVLAAIYDANGEPYAIALANGVFDAFGSISFEGSKATVNFMKISDLTAAAQSNAKAAAARIGGFIQPAGKASVVFAGKSFKVDGELVYDILQKDYELGENGVPTGIDTIATESNDSIYDLNGRRVNSVRSGLYIKKGVKVYMK